MVIESLAYDVTSPFMLLAERQECLDRSHYTTGQFAQKAAVTTRTLRFYDKVGLLSPSEYTETGYRLYSDEDLWRLQQILALKFLGLSLEEIKVCLLTDPERLQQMLAMQKAMMQEKRDQLDVILHALEQTETLLKNQQGNWQAFIHVIQAIQMEQNKDWIHKYLTPEQQQQMAEISHKSYSPEAIQKIAQWGQNWTEEDQQRATRQWDAIFAELRFLVAEGKDPIGPEGQALAKRQHDLIGQFTRGDVDVEAGLAQWWKNYKQMVPEEQQPSAYRSSEEENAFLDKAMVHYRQNLKQM